MAVILCLFFWIIKTALGNISSFSLHIPNAKPLVPETYLCTPMMLNLNQTNFLIGFNPKASSKTAHHMLLYGCDSPGHTDSVFNCGAMTVHDKKLNSALHPCKSGSKIIYAWAQDAPLLQLPPEVGFLVGGDSNIQWLVLQVHYASVDFIPSTGDVSGVELFYTNRYMPKRAGVYFLGTNGRIPALTTTKMETACTLKENITIFPFAFRVHTHKLGKIVSGYKVTERGKSWTLLGKKNPQIPQMFYPVKNNLTLQNGDIVAARCTMVNYRDTATWIGSTRNDEMCNFYLMYWVHGNNTLQNERCVSVGPPIYTWSGWLFGGGLKNIPDEEASNFL